MQNKEIITMTTNLYEKLLELMIYSHVYNYGFNYNLYTYNYDNIYASWIEINTNENSNIFTNKNITLKEFLNDLHDNNKLFKDLCNLNTLDVVLLQEFIEDKLFVRYLSKQEYLDLRK